MRKNRNTAIIVAAGSGTRMQSEEHKQFIRIGGKPILYYTLKAFENSSVIDDIVVVVAPGEEERCYDEIIDKYRIGKIKKVVPGGAKRYFSVYEGLREVDSDCGYVFIHDGARPCVDRDVISRAYSVAQAFDACIVGVQEKDTIRRVRSGNDILEEILDRDEIWHVQTPQVFSASLVKTAYEKFIRMGYDNVTDDAMVVEHMTGHPVHITEGSYRNIKVTTQEDLPLAESYLGVASKGFFH